MTYEPLSDDALKAMWNATFDGSGQQDRLGIRALVSEVRRSRDLLRWREVKVEPLPEDRNAVVEYVAIRADRTVARDVAAVWFVDNHRRQDTTHWRPLTPDPDRRGQRPEGDPSK